MILNNDEPCSEYSASVCSDTVTTCCPPKTCTAASRGDGIEELVRCDHITFKSGGLSMHDKGRQCGAIFHVLCNTSTELSVTSTTTSILDVETNFYSRRSCTTMRFCFEHRPAHSAAARAGGVSQTICGETCSKGMMGNRFSARCGHKRLDGSTGCSKVFHDYCMVRSRSRGSDQLYCFAHLPIDCAFVLADKLTAYTRPSPSG